MTLGENEPSVEPRHGLVYETLSAINSSVHKQSRLGLVSALIFLWSVTGASSYGVYYNIVNNDVHTAGGLGGIAVGFGFTALLTTAMAIGGKRR